MFEHFLTIFIVPNRWLEQSRTLCTYIVAISCKQSIIATCASHMALRDLSGAITLSRKIFLAGDNCPPLDGVTLGEQWASSVFIGYCSIINLKRYFLLLSPLVSSPFEIGLILTPDSFKDFSFFTGLLVTTPHYLRRSNVRPLATSS